jgi:hypothetical protein
MPSDKLRSGKIISHRGFGAASQPSRLAAASSRGACALAALAGCRSPARRATHPPNREDEGTIWPVRAVCGLRIFHLASFVDHLHNWFLRASGHGELLMPRENTRAELNALIERIEHDAFQSGWDAAIKHVLSVAANAPKGDTLPDHASKVAASSTPPRKAGYGVVPVLVRELLSEAGDHGITPAEVVARGRERGDEIAESSVRQRLRKMKIAKEARNERGRWFRVRPATGPAEQETGDADTSPADRL